MLLFTCSSCALFYRYDIQSTSNLFYIQAKEESHRRGFKYRYLLRSTYIQNGQPFYEIFELYSSAEFTVQQYVKLETIPQKTLGKDINQFY